MTETVKRAYRSARRREQAGETRLRTIRAAHDLFVTEGYGRTTIVDVARAAGVAAETIYATYRNHVVGDDVFACEVLSDADDYRYAERAGGSVEIRDVRLPDDVAERCVAVTHALGLHLSGIDLRHAPDGRWFGFEVNPSPGFTYYEDRTGQPIASAVASLLTSARSPSPTG